MKTLLVGINAKFIHSNLAIRYMRDYAKQRNQVIDIAEYTINQRLDYILGELYKHQPDVLGLSCYIWNIELVKQIVTEYKKIQPNCTLILGGPEVSYGSQAFLEQYPQADIIIKGEGEEIFYQVLKAIEHEGDLKDIDGITYQDGNRITENKPRQGLHMDELPFVYENGFEEFDHKIIYYETMRGCPFNCQYCLSSIEKGVRFRSLELVKKELQMFLENKVMQVKFVDRTFNCNKKHAMAIWQYLNEYDNGVTNFHFEISVDLLDDEIIDYLKDVRPTLFQFEIGIQSTHEETLGIIKRKNNFEKIVNNVKRIQKAENIHLHLDLIAGLPKEGYESFKRSFNDVYAMKPEQLQLGFLKVLKGSGLELVEEKYDIVYSSYAPYEVYSTDAITYEELQLLKKVEEMFETYYNSNLFYHTMNYIEGFYNEAFDLYEDLAKYWISKGYFHLKHSRIGIVEKLAEFAETIETIDCEYVKNLLVFDMCLHEKVKKYPSWYIYKQDNKAEMIAFYRNENNIERYLANLSAYDSKQISRLAHIEVFDYDILNSKNGQVIKEETAVLFNYKQKDLMRHNGKYYKINLVVEEE